MRLLRFQLVRNALTIINWSVTSLTCPLIRPLWLHRKAHGLDGHSSGDCEARMDV